MKNFINRNIKNLKSTFFRFPLSCLMGLVIGILMCFVVDDSPNSITISSFVATLFVSLFIFIFIDLLNETLQEKFSSKLYRVFTYGIGGVMTWGIYHIMGRFWNDFSPKIFIYFIGFTMFFIVLSLFVEKIKNPEGHEFYVYRIVRGLFVSSFFSTITFMGISLLLFSISTLFAFDFLGNYILKAFVMTMGTLNLWLFLNNYPNINVYEEWLEPSLAKKVLKNILIPIEIVMSLILYTYFIQILFKGEMPLRIISYLAIVYGCIAGIIIFFSYREKVQSHVLIRYYFPISSLPLLGLMFFTMINRIKQFGLTENRYFVMVIGLFLTFYMVFNLLGRKRHNILTLQVLSVLVLLSIIGPVSGYNLALKSQENRFSSIIARNSSKLKDGELDFKKMEREDRKNLSSIVSYFRERQELSRLNKGNLDIAKLEKVSETDTLQELSGITLVGKLDTKDISSYNTLSYVELNNSGSFNVVVEGGKVRFTLENQSLEYSFDELRKLAEGSTMDKPLVLDYEIEGKKVQVILTDLGLYPSEDKEKYELYSFEGYLFQ